MTCAGRRSRYPHKWTFAFLIAVGVRNFVGTGIFGFLMLRPLPAALEPLETLALDLRWTWSHAGDVAWRRVNPEVGAGPAGAVAAALGVPLVFGLADFFTEEITVIAADVHRVERWLALAGLLALAVVLVISVWRWKRRLGTERRDAERTEGPTPRPWGPARWVRRRPATLDVAKECAGARGSQDFLLGAVTKLLGRLLVFRYGSLCRYQISPVKSFFDNGLAG